AIDALEEDHEFLLAGDVFTEDLVETWIQLKRETEIAPMQAMVSPMEFELYYSV
ncbi:MAG: glutamine synthetase, partial [Yaniella sp.]|nr:glutamine synthetase [Yaniella sp.]